MYKVLVPMATNLDFQLIVWEESFQKWYYTHSVVVYLTVQPEGREREGGGGRRRERREGREKKIERRVRKEREREREEEEGRERVVRGKYFIYPFRGTPYRWIVWAISESSQCNSEWCLSKGSQKDQGLQRISYGSLQAAIVLQRTPN